MIQVMSLEIIKEYPLRRGERVHLRVNEHEYVVTIYSSGGARVQIQWTAPKRKYWADFFYYHGKNNIIMSKNTFDEPMMYHLPTLLNFIKERVEKWRGN